MNTSSLIAGLLFVAGLVTGLVAVLEPVLGLLGIIRKYLRKIVTGRAVKGPLVVDPKDTQDPPMT